MALTPTQISQARAKLLNVATTLRKEAEVLAEIADMLSAVVVPPVTPSPPVNVPAPLGAFTGRTTPDPKLWNLTPVFADNFQTLAGEGEFLGKYPAWSAYPNSYPVTDRSGHYEPNNLSVIDTEGLRVLNCALKPGNITSDGKPWSTAPYPKAAKGLGLRGEFRIRITNPVKGWHSALLMWPDSEQWPRDGELDLAEFDLTDNIGAFVHLQNATDGGDQVEFTSTNKPTDWHVITFEWLADKSFKLFHDGKQIGDTITNRVPNTPMHFVGQVESSGSPTQSSAMQFDWVSFHIPA